MKTVNLEEILRKHSNICLDDQEDVINAMREACNQTIELAAENARTERVYPDLHPSFEIVDKDSILNTKLQII